MLAGNVAADAAIAEPVSTLCFPDGRAKQAIVENLETRAGINAEPGFRAAGARAGSKEVIQIELPRPRVLAVKRTPEFAAYVERVWNLIEKDLHASIQEDAQAAGPAI